MTNVEYQQESPQVTTLHAAAAAGDIGALQNILASGVDVDALDDSGDGRTALIEAVFAGRMEAVDCLLKAGASVDRPDYESGNPLMYAAALGRTDMVERLLKAGAYIEASNAYDRTPLMLAVINGHLETVRFLLDAGADDERYDCEGKTPIIFAGKRNRAAIYRVLFLHAQNRREAEREYEKKQKSKAFLFDCLGILCVLLYAGYELYDAYDHCRKAAEIIENEPFPLYHH